MDTCLAGWILGAAGAELVIVRDGGATPAELTAPATICIEAGGSGDVARGNFDHHGPGAPSETACEQAARFRNVIDPHIRRLVDYVAAMDVGRRPAGGPPEFPTLSNLFSGLLICTPDPVDRFRAGIRLFQLIVEQRIDPFGTMPLRSEWAPFIEAKRRSWTSLSRDAAAIQAFRTRRGAIAGVLVSSMPGALGALYQAGCRYGIAVSDLPGGPEPRRKITIGGCDGATVTHLIEALNEIESGWGGPSHGTIVGSPGGGTAIPIDAICELVREGC